LLFVIDDDCVNYAVIVFSRGHVPSHHKEGAVVFRLTYCSTCAASANYWM
jgi:hypothetical protein